MSWRLAISLVITALTISCAHGGGAQPGGVSAADRATWMTVQGLRPGSLIEVFHSRREVMRGKVVSVNDERLVLSLEPTPVEILRVDIERITLLEGVSRATGAKRGFLIGAVAGATVALTTVESNRTPWTLMLSGGWGALGALFGALSTGRTATLIYEAGPSRGIEPDISLANTRLHPPASVGDRARSKHW